MRKNRGFTLVELLVVIAIMAILLTLITPALQKAREQAKSVLCLTRQNQMAIAMINYVNDHEDRVITVYDNVTATGGQYWIHKIAPYLGDASYQRNVGSSSASVDVEGVMEIAFCPSTSRDPVTSSGFWGNAEYSWRYNEGEGSFGLNLWMAWGGVYKWLMQSEWDHRFGKYSLAKSDTPLFGDSTWVGAWPLHYDRFPPDLYAGDNVNAPGFYMGRFCIDRHDYAINVAFVDGHGEHVFLDELWSFKWNKDFIPGSPPEY